MPIGAFMWAALVGTTAVKAIQRLKARWGLRTSKSLVRISNDGEHNYIQGIRPQDKR